jgi:uncharacterized membrane protein YfcA
MSEDVDYFSLGIFFLITLITEIIGTIGGFGSSLFFVPLAQFFFSMQVVLALTGILHVFSNISKIILFRKTIAWKIVLGLGVSSVVMCIVGAYLTTVMDFSYARRTLGVFLILLSAFLLMKPQFRLMPGLGVQITGGGLAGFLAGFIGTGGAIRGLVLASFNLEQNLFVGTSAAIDFGVDVSRTLIYLDNNYMSMEMLVYLPILLVASFAGSYIGKLLLKRMLPEFFRKLVLWLALAMGFALLT